VVAASASESVSTDSQILFIPDFTERQIE